MEYAELTKAEERKEPSITVFVITLSCHGLMNAGVTYAVIPSKMSNQKMGLKFLNIDKLAEQFSYLKNCYTVILFDACREIAKN